MVSVEPEVDVDGQRRSAARLRLGRGGCRIDFAAEVKPRVTAGSLGAVVAQLRYQTDAGELPPLLIMDYVPPSLASQLREHAQQFADAAGNAYLESAGLFVYVSGHKLDEKGIALRASKGFTTTRLKVLFALICDPDLAAEPYRTIAAAADVALGAMPAVVADLCREGVLVATGKQRQLNASKRLLDDWAQAYALGLRGKTLTGRYLAVHFDCWPDWQLKPGYAAWGGEPAANLLACDLQPQVLTLYAEKLPARLITQQGITAAGPVAYEQLIELRKPFWGRGLCSAGRPDIVPPALVYADLLATGNTRCMEAAQTIYDLRLARHFPVP